MSTVTIRTAAGVTAGELELDDRWFAIEPNIAVMHQVVVAQLAARRAGTQSTKTRAEVSRSSRKSRRQKGGGSSRQGSMRAPQWVGGGVALGPKPRKYNQRTPKKMINLALRSALSDRMSEGKVAVVDTWGWSAPKTKGALTALKALGLDGQKVLVVLNPTDDADVAAARSFGNLQSVQLLQVNELNAYDVLCNDWIVFTTATVPGERATSATSEASDTSTAPAVNEESGS